MLWLILFYSFYATLWDSLPSSCTALYCRGRKVTLLLPLQVEEIVLYRQIATKSVSNCFVSPRHRYCFGRLYLRPVLLETNRSIRRLSVRFFLPTVWGSYRRKSLYHSLQIPIFDSASESSFYRKTIFYLPPKMLLC